MALTKREMLQKVRQDYSKNNSKTNANTTSGTTPSWSSSAETKKDSNKKLTKLEMLQKLDKDYGKTPRTTMSSFAPSAKMTQHEWEMRNRDGGSYQDYLAGKQNNQQSTKNNSKFDGSTLNKTTSYATEIGNAYDYYQGLDNRTTIAGDLTEEERKARIKELNSELRQLKENRSGLDRAAMYGNVGDAITANETRQSEIKKELKELERVGNVSGADMLQWEIEDAKEKVLIASNQAQKYNSTRSKSDAEKFQKTMSELYQAKKELEKLEEKKKIYELGKVVHKDNFLGQWGANYRITDISENAAIAMSDYMSNPTEENKQRALAWYALSEEYMRNNAEALDDEGQVLPLLSDNFASHLAQTKGQAGWGVPLGFLGGAIGSLGGAKGAQAGWTAGYSLGSGIHSYQVIRGSLFNELISYGVDEETAYEFANDDALIEAIIESGETAADWASVFVSGGSSKVASKLLGKTAKIATKYASKPLLKLGIDITKGTVQNAGTEYLEEFGQGAVSRATREKALASIDKEIGQYGKGNIDLHNRPIYKNVDGSISTVDSITVRVDDKFVLLPSIVTDENGKPIKLEKTEDIIAHCEKTGEHLGVFNTLEEANIYADRLHSAQAYRYSGNTSVDADDSILKGSVKVLGDAFFGGNKEALGEMHGQGVEGFKTGIISGGIRGGVKYIVSSFALAKTDNKRNQIADVVLQDNEALTALIEDGKASGEGTVSAKIAVEVEQAKSNGKVTREQVKRLIASNEVYIKAEENTQVQETKPVSTVSAQNSNLPIQEENAVKTPINTHSKGVTLTERLEEQSKVNEPIALNEVKRASGFGENGARLLTEIASQEGMTFLKARDAMKVAYLSGYNGENITFTNDLQNRAKLAGVDDRLVDNNIAIENAKNATVYDGVFTENKYTKNWSEATKKMVSTVAKHFGMDIKTVDKIIANKYTGAEANAYHDDGKMRISNNKSAEKLIHALVMHESGHRMEQLATAEWNELASFLYERAERLGRRAELGFNKGMVFDSVKAEHDRAGITRTTRDYISEIAVRELETVFSSAEEYNNFIAEIESNQQVKSAWGKFVEWLTKLIEDLKTAWSQRNMTAEERAALTELERIKELYAKAYLATKDAVQERAKNQSYETNSAENLEIKTNKEYNRNISHSLKDDLKTKIKYSPAGIKLSANEYAKFNSSTSTDYYKDYKTHEGLQYQSCVFDDKHILYIYEDGGFGKYNPVARIDYADIDVANTIIKEIENGTTYRITDLVDQIIEIIENRRGSYTLYNAYTKKRRRSGGYGLISKGQSKSNTRGTDAGGGRFTGDERGANANTDRSLNEGKSYSLKDNEGNTLNEVEQEYFENLKDENKNGVREGMSDEERYNILVNKSIEDVPKFDAEKLKLVEPKLGTTVAEAYQLKESERKKLFVKIGEEFGVFKNYTNEDIELDFEFSKGGMRESEQHQKGNYEIFAKLFSCFDEVIDRAVGIEVHNRNNEGYKVDISLEEMYVLVSAFEDGENIVPVKLEIKKFNNKENKLYIAVALESIKKNEVVKEGDTNNSVTQASRSFNISLSQLLKNVNPKDEDFIKYIPKQFFDKNTNFSLKGANNISTKERKELLDIIEHLKGEFEITKFAKADPKKLAKMTKDILKEYDSKADVKETFKAIDELYKYMANGEEGHPAVWEEVYNKAYNVAQKIVENALVVDDYFYQEYKSLRDYLRNTPMKFNSKYDSVPPGYENFRDFYRSNFGRLKFTKDGMGVDSVYQELSHLWPEFFNAEEQINIEDQLRTIVDVLDRLQPTEINPFDREIEEVSMKLANDLTSRFFDIPQAKPTFADKAERRVTEARIKGGKRVEAVRQQKDEKIKKLIEAQKGKTKKQLDKLREQRDARVRKEQKKRRDAISKMNETQKAKVLRAQIMRHASELSKKLVNPTDKQHIPYELQGAVAKLLECINLESNYVIDTVTKRRKLKKDYSYNALISKQDIKVTELDASNIYNADGKIDRHNIIKKGIENVREKNNPRNTNENVYVYIPDIDRNVLVGKRGLTHGLSRNADATALVTTKIGDVLENSIRINELYPRKNEIGSYILLGLAKDSNMNYYPVRVIISQYSTVEEVEVLDVLYAVNAKKKNQSSNEAELPADAVPPIKGSSTISISDLLEVVKEDFSDVMTDDVLQQLNVERKESSLSKSLKYTYDSEQVERERAWSRLKDQYEAIKKERPGELVIDPDLAITLGEVATLQGKSLYNMTSTELDTVWQAIRAIEASVNTANKLFSRGKFETILGLAEALRRDNAGKKENTELIGVFGKGKKLATLDMLTPETYFHCLGNAGDSIFRMMRDAQDKHIRIMKEVADFTSKTFKDVDVNSLENTVHNVRLGGEDVQMTTAQLMELYVLMKRKQAIGHIMIGGILPDVTKGKGGKLNTRAEPIRNLSSSEIARALSKLTDEQKKIADKLQRYVSTVLSEYGNEASMKVYNYEKFLEKTYWPIRTNKQEIAGEIGKDTAVTSVANKGMTKGTIPHANTSVRIGSIFDTFSAHSSDMATYAAWLGTSEDVNRIRNFVFWDDGARTGTVKGILDTVHGIHGSEYIEKLLTDVAIGVKGTDNMNPFDKFIGSYKAASVGANLRVIIQQPTAILRALDMIDARYLAEGAIRPLKGWEKAKKYAPVAQWKDWGHFDINTGRQMKDVLFDNASLLEKTKQVGMWGASMADSLAWGQLWNAVETETKTKHKELEVGSETYYETVAKRFTEIIDHTQVVDGILQRSQIMRSPDALTKMATSFMGEPTKQYNMAVSAVYDAVNGKGAIRKNAFTRLGRTAVSLAVAGIVNACAQSIIDAMRDDDKEKEYWEKWLTNFGVNALDVVNVFNYIPYIKDIISIISGYSVTRMDTAAFEKVRNAVMNMAKAVTGTGKYTIAEASAQLFAETAKLYGLPVSNVKRDVKSLVMSIAIASDSYLMQYRIEKAMLDINYAGNSKNFMDILFNAYNNDREAYEYIYKDMLKSGYDAEKIQSGMETRMKKAEGVENVSDLSKRYMTPEDEKKYDSSLGRVKTSRAWKSATSKQRKSAEADLYSFLTSTSESVKEIRAEARALGIDETEYTLWQLAKEVVNDKKASISTTERAKAIQMLDLPSDTEWDLYFFKNDSTGATYAYEKGIECDTYADFIEMLDKYDKPTKNGNYGSYTQAEVREAIDNMKGLSKKEKSTLYQSVNTKWKNNPYR